MKYNRVWRLKNITAVLLLLNSMDFNIVEENGKGSNASGGVSSEAWDRVSMIAPVEKYGRASLSTGL